MAASFGEKLLREVHEEGLDELLRDLRIPRRENIESSRGSLNHCLGATAIDELLEVFMPSLAQPPAEGISEGTSDIQRGDEPVHPETPAHLPPVYNHRTDPVLEISSTSSAAGKSQLLYYLTALAVLPFEYNGVRLHGHESAVVFIDTDGRFDAERLRIIARGIVEHRLQMSAQTSGETLDGSIEAMLFASLQHVHVFWPQSCTTLLATIQSLNAYLLDLSRHESANRPLHAIIIDSATAFFWKDKLQDEIARTEDIGRSMAELERERRDKQSFHLADMYADLVSALKQSQKLFDCAVIYTTVSSTGRPTEKPPAPYDLYDPLDTVFPNAPSFRPPLPPPWGLFPTLRLVVQRDMVRPFPPRMSIDEAQKDAPMRQGVVKRGKFLGWVNGWGREDWPRRIVEGLKKQNGGGFTFYVGQDGVLFHQGDIHP